MITRWLLVASTCAGLLWPATIRPSLKAWLKYAVAGKAEKWGRNYAMNVFLRGDLWDLENDGTPIVWHKDLGLLGGENYQGPQLINLWL